MTNPYPLPREIRETSIFFGDGGTTYGPFDFKIWDEADVIAVVRRASADVYTKETITTTKTSAGQFTTFTVTFSPALSTADRAQVRSRRLHERTTDVTRGGTISTNGLEGELSRQGTVLQELRRDTNRTEFELATEVEDRKEAVAAEASLRAAADDAEAQARAQADAAEAAIRAQADSSINSRLAGAEGLLASTATLQARAEDARDDAADSAGEAAALVQAATAGFTGWPEGEAYDFGYEGPYDAPTYFNRDWGYEN